MRRENDRAGLVEAIPSPGSEDFVMDLTGAAQSPAHDYQIVRRHPAGHRRARRIAIAHGVPIDETVTIFRAKEQRELAGTNAHACYMSWRNLKPDAIIRLEELSPGGRASITMHRSVFLSDEGIVAHLAHELHEVQGLKEAFAEAGGWMRARDLEELIRAGKKGNLHDQAWDEANRVVETRRARSKIRD
jgi:hypothetical protein